MCKVTYDYVAKDGFLTQDIMKFNDLKTAFAFIRSVASRRDVVGKPILERM